MKENLGEVRKAIKKVVVGIACAVTLLLSSMTSAQEISVNVGLKNWYNTWESEGIDEAGREWRDESDDPIMMLGPSITIRSGKVFCGLSYLIALTDYTFERGPGEEATRDRYDLDFVAGYMFHPRVGVLIGYKSLKADLVSPGPGGGVMREKHELRGPGIGVTVNYPIKGTPLVFFGSLNYMRLDFFITPKGEEWAHTEEYSGFSLELGEAYAISEKLSISLSYKYQRFTGGKEHKDSCSGATFGVNWAF